MTREENPALFDCMREVAEARNREIGAAFEDAEV
ncbi:hypothetical protein F4555_000560 [Mobiluncus mulieris]|nr:hypothetical protein [Mobiluncus mulieris]